MNTSSSGKVTSVQRAKGAVRKMGTHDRMRIQDILEGTDAFTDDEVTCALELFDIYLSNPQQKDYDFFCAVDEQDIPLGYLCYGKAPFTDAVFYLYWIAVHPRSQGAGIGQQLMKHLDKILARQNARMLLIETASKASYEQTRSFYRRNGFTEWSRIKDFYRLDDDRITYGKLCENNNTVITTVISKQDSAQAQ
jgi:ribosomal protein S18 acetylase RimI-like enzyme